MRRFWARRRARRVPASLRLPAPQWPRVTPPTVAGSHEIPMHCHDCKEPVQGWWWTCRGCGAVQDLECDSDARLTLVAGSTARDGLLTPIREAAVAVRPSIREAWVHLVADEWPAQVRAAVAHLREVGVVGKPNGDIVDIDPTDDAQVEAFLSVLPYALHAEAYLDQRIVLVVADSGTSVSCAPDRAERAALARAMDRRGQVLEDVFRLWRDR